MASPLFDSEEKVKPRSKFNQLEEANF